MCERFRNPEAFFSFDCTSIGERADAHGNCFFQMKKRGCNILRKLIHRALLRTFVEQPKIMNMAMMNYDNRHEIILHEECLDLTGRVG
jgi:hypothetical protein